MINKITAIWHILTRKRYFVLTEGIKINIQAASPDERGIVFELILGALDVKKKQEEKNET